MPALINECILVMLPWLRLLLNSGLGPFPNASFLRIVQVRCMVAARLASATEEAPLVRPAAFPWCSAPPVLPSGAELGAPPSWLGLLFAASACVWEF